MLRFFILISIVFHALNSIWMDRWSFRCLHLNTSFIFMHVLPFADLILLNSSYREEYMQDYISILDHETIDNLIDLPVLEYRAFFSIEGWDGGGNAK